MLATGSGSAWLERPHRRCARIFLRSTLCNIDIDIDIGIGIGIEIEIEMR